MATFSIHRDDADQRLDRFLRKLLPSATLGGIMKLIRKGRVRVDGRRARPDQRLTEGQSVEIRLADGRLDELREDRGSRRSAPVAHSREALTILYEDDHVLAMDKPPFLVVQKGGSETEPTLEELVLESRPPSRSLTFRPALAHRLDRGTSGVVLLGLSAAGLRGLTEAFRERRVRKVYLALTTGEATEDEFDVEAPLSTDLRDDRRGKRTRISHGPDAQTARTHFRVLARGGGRTLVEAHPVTGRTHQIRAHLRHVGLPIVGDPVYGDPADRETAKRQAGLWRTFLHARSIALEHPVLTGHRLRVVSPVPEDLIRVLRWSGLGTDEAPAE